jgi:hypothetical protein
MVSLVVALQYKIHKSLNLRIRRNCLAFFGVKDGDASRVILGAGGAEQLPPRQFMTVMNQLLRGIAYAPSDGEMAVFLPRLLLFAHHDLSEKQGCLYA